MFFWKPISILIITLLMISCDRIESPSSEDLTIESLTTDDLIGIWKIESIKTLGVATLIVEKDLFDIPKGFIADSTITDGGSGKCLTLSVAYEPEYISGFSNLKCLFVSEPLVSKKDGVKRKHIVFITKASDLEDNPSGYDIESTMILGIKNGVIQLGGDFEVQHLSNMMPQKTIGKKPDYGNLKIIVDNAILTSPPPNDSFFEVILSKKPDNKKLTVSFDRKKTLKIPKGLPVGTYSLTITGKNDKKSNATSDTASLESVVIKKDSLTEVHVTLKK